MSNTITLSKSTITKTNNISKSSNFGKDIDPPPFPRPDSGNESSQNKSNDDFEYLSHSVSCLDT
jgi:hypothetical protein